MGKAGVTEDLARLAVIVLVDQDPARQDTKRSLDDAHILIEHQMVDVGAVEQRSYRRNKHDVVGSNQFPHLAFSFIPDSEDFVAGSNPCRASRHFLWLYPRLWPIG
jgi:hypothetical protein